MTYFPIILIPTEIQRVKSTLPPTPVFNESMPEPPGAEPKKVKTKQIAVEATAVTVPSVAMISQEATAPGFLLLLAGLGAIAAQVWRQITTFPKRRSRYERQLVDYSDRLREYDRKKQRHEDELKASQHPQRIAQFQYKLLLDILRRTNSYDGNDSDAPPGWSERQFNSWLNRYFPGKIYTKLTLTIPNFDHPYTPDFAYIDQQTNLHIDIEIDEPYTYRKGEPTHYLGARKDERRNDFFTDKGWIVIRFSEEQIICHPQSCCKTIAHVIAEVTENKSLLNQFINFPDLQEQRQWTETEALEMANRQARDRYIER